MLKAGQVLPPFRAKRLPDHAPGFWGNAAEVVESAGLMSRSPAVLAVVKRDCPTCRYALPFFDRLYRLHRHSAPVILLAQENEVAAREMVDEDELEIPVLLDESPHPIGEQCEVAFVPATFLVSRGGRIQTSFESFERESLGEIHHRLERLCGKEKTSFYGEGERVDAFRPG